MKNEILYGLIFDDKLIAIGGLNIDPYSSENSLVRVRHLYVSKKYRRNNIGRILLDKILTYARGRFLRVRLYSDNIESGKFYISCGFSESVEEHGNYSLELKYYFPVNVSSRTSS